jgi:hypothetical protein
MHLRWGTPVDPDPDQCLAGVKKLGKKLGNNFFR